MFAGHLFKSMEGTQSSSEFGLTVFSLAALDTVTSAVEHVKIIGLEEAAGKLLFDQERISESLRWSAFLCPVCLSSFLWHQMNC